MPEKHPSNSVLPESLLQANPFGRKGREVENRFVAPEAKSFVKNPEDLTARSLSLGKKPARQFLGINPPIQQGDSRTPMTRAGLIGSLSKFFVGLITIAGSMLIGALIGSAAGGAPGLIVGGIAGFWTGTGIVIVSSFPR